MLKSRLSLGHDHPTFVKFQKLCDYATKLGLTLSWAGQDLILHDQDQGSAVFHLEDLEEDCWFDSFPPSSGYRVAKDNPDYDSCIKEFVKGMAK